MRFRHPRWPHCWAGLFLVSALSHGLGRSWAQEVDGFTAPYRTVSVATAETGVVLKILVREGDFVEPGQVLAGLDHDVYSSLVAIAEQGMRAAGTLAAGVAEARLRKDRLKKLEQLLSRGNASQEEVERARADSTIAENEVLALREELLLKKLDCERARLQLERRTIRAPMRGVVTELHKEEGEFIGPNDPQLLTMVQLDPLLAMFSVSSPAARRAKVGQLVQVRMAGEDSLVKGTVEFVAPVVDGKSGTVRVKVRLDNRDGRWRSGEACSLLGDQWSEGLARFGVDEAPIPAFPKLKVQSLE